MLDRRNQQHIQQLNREQMKDLFQGLDFREGKPVVQSKTLPYDPLDRLNQRQREFVEHWRQIFDRNDKGLAQLFMQQVPQALEKMDFDGVEAWLLTALEQFDQRGIGWAQQVLHSVEHFSSHWSERSSRLSLNDVSILLRAYAIGPWVGVNYSWWVLNIAIPIQKRFIYPLNYSRCTSQEDNFLLYKALAVHHWAQTWYGSWRVQT